MSENPGEVRARRFKSQRRDFWIGLALTLVCIVGMSIWVATVAHNEKVEGKERKVSIVNSQRDGCMRTSERTAADVNLNWTNYMAEHELSMMRVNQQQLVAILGLQTPEVQKLIQFLISSQQFSRGQVIALANANYNAAWEKAKSVDVQDAKLITAATPRAWALRANFSCARAYK